MASSFVVALIVMSTTPDEATPTADTKAVAPHHRAQPDGSNAGATRVTTIVAPPFAIVVGTLAGVLTSLAFSYGPVPGAVAAGIGFAMGVAAFEVTLGLALHAFLPTLPAWTVPVALVTATSAGALGLAVSAGLSLAYLDASGGDGCGPEFYVIPAAIFATTAAAASTATTLTVMAAELE